MDNALIDRMAGATLTGSLPFPAIVGQLMAAGVEYYRVDYVRREQTCYSARGESHAVPLTLSLPAVADTFDGPALVAAIRDSQLRGQKFTDFSARAVQAGVQGYTAFLRGQRVVYQGRQGDQHTEWFPGAGPRS